MNKNDQSKTEGTPHVGSSAVLGNSELEKLADKIARGIIASGDEPKSPCIRIQFKGGDWPDNETNQGGLCESSLAKNILKTLMAELPNEKVQI